MIIVPLGIASATPTAARHLPSLALWREGDVFLFDCGENTQMRMLQAGVKRSKVNTIFISHFDCDHFSGLIGLLSTLQLQRREAELTIVGPKGIKEFVEWNVNFIKLALSYEIKYVEVEEGTDHQVVLDNPDYFVEARALKHRKYCMGFRFQEKDKPGKVDAKKAAELGITEDEHFKALKAGENITLANGTVVESSDVVGHPRPGDSFAYISDTQYCPNAVKLALNTNILYHEATFSSALADKASETGHSTAVDAARVATEAQTKLLVIAHFSARYTNPFVLLREARQNFFPTWLATELRPIFTDPAHEKGIIQAKIPLTDTHSKSSPQNRSNKRFQKRPSNKPNFRHRRGYDQNSGSSYSSNRYSGGDSYNRADRGDEGYNNGGYRDRDYDRGNDNNRDAGKYYRSNRENNNNNEDVETKKPKHITPRTPFDDFNRF